MQTDSLNSFLFWTCLGLGEEGGRELPALSSCWSPPSSCSSTPSSVSPSLSSSSPEEAPPYSNCLLTCLTILQYWPAGSYPLLSCAVGDYFSSSWQLTKLTTHHTETPDTEGVALHYSTRHKRQIEHLLQNHKISLNNYHRTKSQLLVGDGNARHLCLTYRQDSKEFPWRPSLFLSHDLKHSLSLFLLIFSLHLAVWCLFLL